MITFSNWRIPSNQKIIALQHDHKTCALTVSGDLPEGWNWELILFSGGLPDEIPLTPSSDGVSAVLSSQNLARSGFCSLQLRGKVGDKIRHTNVIHLLVSESLAAPD